jgi:hypothetical protein
MTEITVPAANSELSKPDRGLVRRTRVVEDEARNVREIDLLPVTANDRDGDRGVESEPVFHGGRLDLDAELGRVAEEIGEEVLGDADVRHRGIRISIRRLKPAGRLLDAREDADRGSPEGSDVTRGLVARRRGLRQCVHPEPSLPRLAA